MGTLGDYLSAMHGHVPSSCEIDVVVVVVTVVVGINGVVGFRRM